MEWIGRFPAVAYATSLKYFAQGGFGVRAQRERLAIEVDLDLLKMIEILHDVDPLQFPIAASEMFFEFHAHYQSEE